MSEQTTQEQIVEMDINLLRTFKDHPFKVTADYPMIQLKESIESFGILTPLLVRPLKDGSYEIISGHRRKHAAQMLGLKTVIETGFRWITAVVITTNPKVRDV